MAASAARAAFLKLARARFKQADEADKAQRDRELDDLRFYAGDQWPADIKASRAGLQDGNAGGLPPIPARPCITINKTREPVRIVLNQERGADMGIEIVPADDFGDLAEPISETEIQLREGLVRRIQRESKAADARTWGFARSAIAGRGYYMVMTRYVAGKTRDQEVYIHRIYNQSSVLGDPAREQPDGSDAEFWFIGANVPWNRYKAEYKQRNGKPNDICGCSDDEWRAMGDEQPDWFVGEGETRSVLVVDYLYTERETRELVTYAQGEQERTEWLDEVPEAPEGWTEVQDSRRTDIQKTIKWAQIDGCDDDVLEETDWQGPDMPVIQILGEELQPYDKERRCEGMVRPMREPCQGNNAMVSKFVEMVAMTPIPTLMMAAGQQEGFEEWYKAATTRTLPYLLYNQKDVNDMPAGQPFAPANRDMPIAPVAAGLQMFDEAIQSTSISNSAFGQTDATVNSAKHAALLKEQSLQGTSNYLDQLKRSMEYEAKVINGLLYPIYGRRKGRLARLVNGQGEAETVLLHQPMIQQNGRPVAAENDPNAKTYTLTKDAQFNIAVKISKNYDTRRQQEATTIGELLGQAPQLMTWFGDLFFKNQDGPGHMEMADRAKVMLDPKILQLLESKKQGMEIPPHVQAQLAQAQQQIQQLTQVAQQMQQQIQTEAVKEQAETQRNTDKLHAQVEIERLKQEAESLRFDREIASKIEIARIGQEKVLLQAQEEARLEALALGEQQRHEVGMAAMQGVSGAQSAASDQQHQAQMAAQGQAATSAEADAGRAHEAEQAEIARQAAAEQAAGSEQA